MAVNPRIILASQSPRRKELLSFLGLIFEVVPSTVEEIVDPGLKPHEVVADLAAQKAHDVLKTVNTDDTIVLGADTIVVLDDEVIGKPRSKSEAHEMLLKLSARKHIVYTGVKILGAGNAKHIVLGATETSYVSFRKLEPQEITAYIETGEPMDKAGAYALQGTGSAFVEKIEGCFTNVIGLPIPKTVSLLRQAGVTILGMPQ